MIFYSTFFPRNFSLLYLIILVLFSLFLLCFSICSLLSSDPNTILLPISTSQWLIFYGGFSGCFFLFFFFSFFVFCFFCDRCLKEEVGMAEVGCELWLGSVFGSLVVVGPWLGSVFGLWVKWTVGRRSSPIFGFDEVMVRSTWVTVMSLVEIGMGHRMVSWFFWVLPF